MIWKNRQGLRQVLLLGLTFFSVMVFLNVIRHELFFSSYDQGLFNQVFWNSLHGRWFESSLTSANSIAIMQDGKTAVVSFQHLAHHFVPNFLLWVPLYSLFPDPITLIIIQVGLMTLGGLVLFALARHHLPVELSVWITGSYYGAHAVIGPTLANFYEQCQIPLFAFSMILAFSKRWWILFWICVLLVLGIREDAGFIVCAFGIYLIGSKRSPSLGLALCLISFSYVTIVTNYITPLFADDSNRLYLANRFRQFVDGDNPTALQVLWGFITRPGQVISTIFNPWDRKLNYLLRQWLSLGLITILSPSTWLCISIPLLGIFLQEGQSALSMNLRYAIAVVPGIFYGAILWWSQHPHWFTSWVKRWWGTAIALSIIVCLISNPNQSLSYIIPDSVNPLVYSSLPSQLQHSIVIRNLLAKIPPEVNVSATTHLIPHLSNRRGLIRLPQISLINDSGRPVDVDYIIADLAQLEKYKVVFNTEKHYFNQITPVLNKIISQGKYQVIGWDDGVMLLKRVK